MAKGVQSWVYRLLGVALSIVLLVVLAVILTGSDRPNGVQRTPKGRVVRLEGYNFKTGVVRYYWPKDLKGRPLVRAALETLPSVLLKRARFLPQPMGVVRSDSPGEPFLSVFFTAEETGGTISRVIVSDDRGQSFDGVVSSLGSYGVFELRGFPRRGTELLLRPMFGNEDSGVVFRIPNPCRGPHPVWTADPLPMTQTNSGLRVTFESFSADHERARTRCTFRLQGEADFARMPKVSVEVSDAAGNHWKPVIDRVEGGNGLIRCYLFGALWSDENAWKVRVEFKLNTDDASNGRVCLVQFLAKPEHL